MAAHTPASKRFISGVVISSGLALLALAAPAAHAAALPHISASVTGRTTIAVGGYGFGPGNRVEVIGTVGGTVIGRAFTTATLPPIPTPRPPKCSSPTPCQQYTVPPLWGRIAVTLPTHAVRCTFETVAVRAHDLTTHTQSNVAYVRLGIGPCPVRS